MFVGNASSDADLEHPRAWSASDDISSSLSTISCEPCRHKKRKCDRLLPSCTLCTTSGARCQYPERGKRGMPIGYITQLEERLNEVETALFRLRANYELYRAGRQPLTSSTQSTLESVADYYNGLSKQEKIASWRKHNLITDAGREHWWREMNQRLQLQLNVPTLTMMKTEAEASGDLQRPTAYTSSNTTLESTPMDEASIEDILSMIPKDERHKYF